MPYLNLDLNYFDHPKTRRLLGLLGPMADVIPLRLWAYCAKIHPRDGYMKGYSEDEINAIVGMGPDISTSREGSTTATQALIRVGFLKQSQGGFVCVDWLQHQGHLEAFSRRGRENAKKRWDAVASGNASSITNSNAKNKSSNAPTKPTKPSKPTESIKTIANAKEPEVIKPPTPIQRVVEAYKIAKDVKKDDKDWDENNFKRYCKSASHLLKCFGQDVEKCAAYIFLRAEDLNEKRLDWTLETITRHAFDGIGIPKKEDNNGHEVKPLGANCLPVTGRTGRFASSRSLAGDTLRAIELSAIRPDGGGNMDGPEPNQSRDDEDFS